MRERTISTGRLASLRLQVHHLLDARWKYGCETRRESYLWLATVMCVDPGECHVGMFDEADCERALELLKAAGIPAL